MGRREHQALTCGFWGSSDVWPWVNVSSPDTAETLRSAQVGMGRARLPQCVWEARGGCFAGGFQVWRCSREETLAFIEVFLKGFESGVGGCCSGGSWLCWGCRQPRMLHCDHLHTWPSAVPSRGRTLAGMGGLCDTHRRQGKGPPSSTPSSSVSSNSSAFLYITDII